MAKTWEVDFLQSRKPIEAEFKGSAVYKLPIASPEELGGVKPVAKTEDMVQPVGVDAEGALWVAESLTDGKLVDVVKSVNGQTPDENGNVDLTGYATEQYVQEYAQPKGDYALRSEIPSVPVQSVNGKTGAVTLSASDVGARPNNWMPSAQEVGALPNTYTPPNQTAEQVGADPKGTAASAVSQHNTAYDSHNDIRLELKAINNRLTAFFDSDNQTLDELSEIVDYITSNKSLIDSITTSKVGIADIIDNLTTNVSNKPLSAAQGMVLKGLIDTLSSNLANYQPKGNYLTKVPDGYATEEFVKNKIAEAELGGEEVDLSGYALKSELPTKVSHLENDKGYLTEHQDISGKLDASALPTAINTALAQAKASGEFDGVDGKDGYTPVKGVDYFDGKDGKDGKDGMDSTLYVTPQMFGAKADGVTDDTDAINAAIVAAGNGGAVYIPDGTYLVNSGADFFAVKIENMRDFTLMLSDGATLKHAVTNLEKYRVIGVLSSERIRITGGHIEGDKDIYTGTAFMDWGHGIRVCDSTDVTIKDVEISLCRGDGISLASEQITATTYGYNKNIVIDNCRVHDCFRNGMHFGSVTGGLVRNTEIYNIIGGNPQAAVDIEAEYPGSVNDDLTFDGCYFHDCGKQSVAVMCVATNVLFTDCRFNGYINTSTTLTNIRFEGCYMDTFNSNSDVTVKSCTVGAINCYSGCEVTAIGCQFIMVDEWKYSVGFYESAVNVASVKCIGCVFWGETDSSRAFVYAAVKPKGISFDSCTFHLERTVTFTRNMGDAVFNSCVFMDSRNNAYQLAAITCDSLILKDCVFDCSNYLVSGGEAIVKVSATNVTVDGCLWKTVSTTKRTVPFSASGATGVVIFVNNILPQWATPGTMPTGASKLLCTGNILSGSAEYLTQNDLGSAVNTALAQAKASGEFNGKDGKDGADGKTPVNGTDYFTSADKAEMVTAVKALLTNETWTFELENGSTVSKVVLLG